jgi:iron complex transport system ATP-binding protein
MLEAQKLCYRRGQRLLLQDISLTAQPGELTVIIGPNGAGKSTLLALLSGALTATSGQVRFDQLVPGSLSAERLAQLRAVVEQQPACPEGMLAAELVAMGGYRVAKSAFGWQQAMTLAQCSQLAGRRMETLSGGERQRVHLARALLQIMGSSAAERFLLLDEPTAALDFGQADGLLRQVRQLAQQHGIGIVAVVHDLNLTVRHADQVLLLANGRAAAFGPCSAVMQKTRLESIYGVHLAELMSQDLQHRAFIPLGKPETPNGE